MTKRAISVHEILAKKYKIMAFDGAYKESFGEPELKGGWIIWGGSGNGKTRFVMKLCKYLTRFGRVVYDSLEEGDSGSMQRAIREERMIEVAKRFTLLDSEPLEDLKERLRKPKSADIIVIDSIQYAQLSYKKWIELKSEFKNKLFLLISHAEGKQPAGKPANQIRYDCALKIRVEGYKAFNAGRYGGNADFIIWPEGAAQYWGDIN